MTDRVDRAERLLNLVFALMTASPAVPRSVIRDQVPGYAGATSDGAFERMFERDKDELRSMGIPVETVLDEFGDVQGYRVARDAYVMPPMEFTVEERSAIAVAAQVWGHAQVAPVAGTALRKMESVSVDPGHWAPSDLRGEVYLSTSDAALLPVMSAIRSGLILTFDYRTPAGAETLRRTVSPWGLTVRDGHWMLTGFDHDRDAQRTVRVSRIQGTVTVTAKARREPDAGAEVASGVDAPSFHARVTVEPGHGASLRRAAVPAGSGWDRDEFDVAVASEEALVSLVCGAAGHARVVEPAEAVDAVSAALSRVLDAHREATR
jgi:proteasome accessory factor B